MFKVDELVSAVNGSMVCGNTGGRVSGISIDSRTIKPLEAFIAIEGNNFDGHGFIAEAIKKKASAIIASKPAAGCQIPFILVDDTLKALGDIASFHRQRFDIPVIAVTGSNGKTTTKEMIAAVLSRRFKVLKNEGTKNNPIGLPMTLLGLDRSYDVAVLEAGTNHFGELDYLARICRPNIGVITNIGASHLEFFESLEGVFKEKSSLLYNLAAPRLAILNSDDPFLRKKLNSRARHPFLVGVGMKNRADFTASGAVLRGKKTHFLVSGEYGFTLNTPGACNIYNALAAIAVARIFGLSYKDMSKALAGFVFPRGRLSVVKFKSIRFIDDTYNSNPFSLIHALEALEKFKTNGRKIFVMGDMGELGLSAQFFHEQAGKKIAQVCDKLVTVGRLSVLAARSAGRAGLEKENIFSCETSMEARDILFNKISPLPRDIVLVKGSRSMKMEEVFKEG